MTCRKRMDDVKTGGKSLTRDQSGGWPDCCPDGIRHEGGVTLGQALARNVGTCRPDVKGDIQAGGPCEDQSTAAGHRGGATPFLQPHYRAFVTTTGFSPPVPRHGTLILPGAPPLGVSLHLRGPS